MMAKQTRKIPGIVKIIRKTEKEAVKYGELLGDQCLNTYLTLMLKPSKLSDLFPHAR